MIWQTLFEPFDKTQDRLRELVCSPKIRVCPILWSLSGRQWFWAILPKQKDLGYRAEIRYHQKSIETVGENAMLKREESVVGRFGR